MGLSTDDRLAAQAKELVDQEKGQSGGHQEERGQGRGGAKKAVQDAEIDPDRHGHCPAHVEHNGRRELVDGRDPAQHDRGAR